MLSTSLKLILLSTILLNASPKAFDSLGNELEKFQKDCKDFQAISLLPSQIKKHCEGYISNVHKAFKVGYKLDPYIDTDNLNETELNKYLELLHQSDEKKSIILRLILLEKKKARQENNFAYYSQLIAKDNVKLFHSDYEFMKKNIEIFGQNERYLSHLSFLKSLQEARQANLELERKRTQERKKEAQNRLADSKQKQNEEHYFITSIKKIEIYEENTDADPLADDAKIYIVFGNSKGAEVRPPDGMEFDYSITIHEYYDSFGQAERIGRKLASSDGKLISERGFTSVFMKMPDIKKSTRIFTETKVTLPNGTVLINNDKDYFNP